MDLNSPCEQRHVPFMAQDLPDDFVERPQEFDALVSKLLNESREEPIAITTALRGAGGYGKTTIAKAICHDECIQEAFDDGILWVTLGERPDDLVGKVEDLIYILSRERFDFSGLEAATSRLVELLSDRDILLVIDDVWNAAHLKPFLQGGKRCARLITTRDEAVLPRNAQAIQVDAMQQDQAVQLLSTGLDAILCTGDETVALLELVARLGEWPLLLTLVNGALREKVIRGQRLSDALTSINKALERRGLTAFDAHNAEERSQAVARTLGVSFDLLSVNDHTRYRELVIFPEDVDIPLTTIAKLWSMTGKLDEVDTDEVCERMYKLSLLLRCDLAARTIRLHDIMRTYLQWNISVAELAVLHGQLLDAYGCKRWAELPLNEPYLWDHLAEHLIEAGRWENLIATVKDGSYLAAKICARSVFSVEADLDRAERQLPTDASLQLLKRSVVHMSHILNRCRAVDEAKCVLYSRLAHLPELRSIYNPLEQELPRPFLVPWHPLPDLPHVALIRTLQGHFGMVNGCAVSPTGDYIVSASDDWTLKVWDARTGSCIATIYASFGLLQCAFLPDGEHLVAVGDGGIYFLYLAK